MNICLFRGSNDRFYVIVAIIMCRNDQIVSSSCQNVQTMHLASGNEHNTSARLTTTDNTCNGSPEAENGCTLTYRQRRRLQAAQKTSNGTFSLHIHLKFSTCMLWNVIWYAMLLIYTVNEGYTYSPSITAYVSAHINWVATFFVAVSTMCYCMSDCTHHTCPVLVIYWTYC